MGMQECVSYRGVRKGTNLTAFPVLFAQNAAVSLHNIQSQVEHHAIIPLPRAHEIFKTLAKTDLADFERVSNIENRTHIFGHMHIGQAVQAKDVALLPVMINL